ncbi:hypothetical protein PNH38_06195 [Anoxybacillus rupiensis]|jgi:hypothetical protein|uniref:ABC transporter permease n=1 Tax=Anoxybacteroides rupiense TaxID=311460 RepID=A0ABD5IYI1_9BACL|nr:MULTISPECIES: hypothetical protein [Anoxybacillus]MBS2772133.1 hypothetical protein [Anoxybacillus rupiensis]MDE8563478.1 hypothetical protein [Anoxybacillus rupiensis]MED5053427.1 hypothetical protein [Anoxybacillus rupiensis]QHC02880.1 hypothetical protein GRQ40_02015 [Anoxybacillus sp. PDR2]
MKPYIEWIRTAFTFDRKTMGGAFFVPPAMFALSLLLILLIPRKSQSIYDNVIIIQGLFIPFSGWCLTYRFGEMYEDGAQETLVPYYAKWFWADVFRYFFVHMLGVVLLSIALGWKYGASSLSPLNMIHFVILTLFYLFFSTTLIVLVKNVDISLTVIFIYTVLEVATLGTFMPWPHIFLFDPPVWDPFFISKLTVLSLAVLLLVSITVVWIRRGDRKPQ